MEIEPIYKLSLKLNKIKLLQKHGMTIKDFEDLFQNEEAMSSPSLTAEEVVESLVFVEELKRFPNLEEAQFHYESQLLQLFISEVKNAGLWQ